MGPALDRRLVRTTCQSAKGLRPGLGAAEAPLDFGASEIHKLRIQRI